MIDSKGCTLSTSPVLGIFFLGLFFRMFLLDVAQSFRLPTLAQRVEGRVDVHLPSTYQSILGDKNLGDVSKPSGVEVRTVLKGVGGEGGRGMCCLKLVGL